MTKEEENQPREERFSLPKQVIDLLMESVQLNKPMTADLIATMVKQSIQKVEPLEPEKAKK